MNHFSLKSLSFYGVAIASVLVLFKIVTVYGETRLTASPPIAGSYRLTPSGESSCLGKNPRIAIEQSGIYLRGTLSTAETSVPLDGRFQGVSLQLQGSGDKSCADPVVVKAIVEGKSLSGTIDGVAVTFERERESIEGESSIGH
jgi:hypothetical protein